MLPCVNVSLTNGVLRATCIFTCHSFIAGTHHSRMSTMKGAHVGFNNAATASERQNRTKHTLRPLTWRPRCAIALFTATPCTWTLPTTPGKHIAMDPSTGATPSLRSMGA
eukprot:GEMP01132339.1.p1 GENE.GEMP01132339.1~~GEMP01132339.1.p1  ORF type:complete len:110 (-),score=14.52 GEMP01132339.1:134-463(-)